LQQRTYQNNLTAAAGNLQKLIEAQDYDQAEKYLAELRSTLPAIASEPSIRSLEQQLAKENSAERKRLADLQEHWEALEKSDPDNLDPLRLEQAEALVKTEQEKLVLKQWQQRAATAKDNKQLAIDSAFSKELDDLRDEVTTFVQAPLDDDFSKADKEQKDLRTKIRQMQNRAGISPGVLDQLPPLEAKLDTRWQVWDRQRRMDDELAHWLTISSNPEVYAKTLLEFSKRYPQAARGQAAAEISDEASLWTASDAWLKLLNNKELYSNSLSSADAKRYLELGQQSLEQFPKHPLALEYLKHQPRLEAIASRSKSDSTTLITEDLRSLFRDPVFTDLQMVELKNGIRYYLTKENAEKIRYDNWRPGILEKIDCLTHFNGTTSNYRVDKAQVQLFGGARHCSLCAKLLELLSKVDHLNWDAQHLAMVRAIEEHMKDASADIDPILNAIILKQVLRQGAAGSIRFRTVYADKIKVLATEDLDLSVNWLKPDDETVTKARAVTKAVLQDYLAAPLATAPALLFKPELHERQGFLFRSAAGNWSWKVAQLPQGKAELAVVWQPPGNDVSPEFMTVAELDNGRIVWRDNAGLSECRPIYLLRK
jgi:hypothetical protein